uniref:Uncharacterized protein n=1 Tax=Arundo donax TaxID=35708 RepID=A0A0A8Z771_ARUDO
MGRARKRGRAGVDGDMESGRAGPYRMRRPRWSGTRGGGVVSGETAR